MKKLLLFLLIATTSLAAMQNTTLQTNGDLRVNYSNLKVILIHGNNGSKPTDNWIPYVKAELENAGIPVIAPQFPDSDLARACYWIPFLHELQADENTILIGHSSGAIASMRFAEKTKILGSILIGSYYTDLGFEKEKISGYFDAPWCWEAIKNNQQWIVQFASTDDPWIPIHEPQFVRDMLNTEYYEFDDQGHFGGDYHKSTFPEVVNAIKNKLRME
jgi:predicted alpha/beta hydrolase family esterase